ncbi:hypothetical protein, partial [Acetobacter lovaniensis]
RPDAIAKTVNQIAKSQKLPAKHINQRFFDPSTFRFPLQSRHGVSPRREISPTKNGLILT